MNNDLTEIAYILDRSGSMQGMVAPAITGFNQFLQEQCNAHGSARLTLVLFDNEYKVPHKSVPIEQVPELTTKTYQPGASTALLDAIGRTINELGERLAATQEADRPGHVIVVIFTDGLENSSTQFTWQQISDMIKHQREKYSWKFMFLAANQDAIATASKISIDRDYAGRVSASYKGFSSFSPGISRKLSSLRKSFSTGERDIDYDTSLQEIVADEESKRP